MTKQQQHARSEELCNKQEPDFYEDDRITQLWEHYHRPGDKLKRREIKAEHNALTNEINNRLKRKVYLTI